MELQVAVENKNLDKEELLIPIETLMQSALERKRIYFYFMLRLKLQISVYFKITIT